MLDVAAAITTIGVFALRGDRRGGQRERREAEAGEHGDLVVDDQLLRDAPGRVGHAGVVLEDQLDLASGDRVAVLRQVEPGAGLDLPAGGGERAGHRQDQADLQRSSCARADPTRPGPVATITDAPTTTERRNTWRRFMLPPLARNG